AGTAAVAQLGAGPLIGAREQPGGRGRKGLGGRRRYAWVEPFRFPPDPLPTGLRPGPAKGLRPFRYPVKGLRPFQNPLGPALHQPRTRMDSPTPAWLLRLTPHALGVSIRCPTSPAEGSHS